MKILVTGATGFIGSRLVPALVERGHDVVALTRDADSYDGAADTVCEGDVLEAGSFEHALDGVDAAYYLVHSMASSEDFVEKDRRAAQNFREATDEAGVERVVYLSGLGEDDDDLSAHLRSRREVERVLSTGWFDLTTLRAAIIIGAGNDSFRIVRQLAGRLPVMVTPRWVRQDCQPIAVTDVVAYLVGVVETPATAGHTYEVGGPEELTYQEFIGRTADAGVGVAGRRPLVVPVPVLTPQLSTYWVELVTDVPRSLVRPLIHGLENEVTTDDDAIREHVPIALTSYETAIERALAAADGPDVDGPVVDGPAVDEPHDEQDDDGPDDDRRSDGPLPATTAGRASRKLDRCVLPE